jgi:hypothetical protein
MVKPTKPTDAIVSVNRFAILGSATFGNQNPATLNPVGSSAGDKITTNPPAASLGAISKPPLVKNITRKQSEIPGLCYSSAIRGKFPRDRSNSMKRKNSAEDNNSAKAAKVDMECPHLKVIDENKAMLSRTIDSIADYKGNDPILAEGIRNLSICMNNINEILGVVMAERLVPGPSPEVQFCKEVSGENQNSKFQYPSAAEQNRKPLKQKPLGDTETWATAVSRNTKRTQQSQGHHDNNPGKSDQAATGNPSNEDPFIKAVKEAERSLLVFNLDMGQSPIMNPNTISTKVTLSLLDLAAAKAGLGKGEHTPDSRELIDDIISQVVRMEFFGSKTSHCKFPGNSALDGSFYTVPVKFVFKDRRTAQTAADLLRKQLNLNSITPYHKTLKAAITQAINRAKAANPGHHAKANLDLNGRSLKVMVRTEGNPPGSWTPWGKNIPLPPAALDPGTRDITKVILPTSPNSPALRGAEASNSNSQNNTNGKEKGDSWADDSDSETADNEVMDYDKEGDIPPGAVRGKLKVFGTYPDPSQSDKRKESGNEAHVFSGRSSLTLRTPPRINNDKEGSFGS